MVHRTEKFVKETLLDAEGGHDWMHAQRVRKLALYIASKENADLLIVELASLLHDIADSKFNDGDEEAGPVKAREFLLSLSLEEPVISKIENIIRNISFKTQSDPHKIQSIEFKTVQDADRLDAMGAIGIARAFNYGGYKNQPICDPEILPQLNMSKEEYKNSKGPTINHFYEKLLLLKDLMNTETGRKMAIRRHQFMEIYLEEFFKEYNWPGEF